MPDYDAPLKYKERLDNAYEAEKNQLASLQSATDTQRQNLAGTQTDYGTRGLYGAAQGGGAAALRGATYAGGDLRQGVANEAAAQKLSDDEAFRRYQMELESRRGQYGLMGMQGDTDFQAWLREQEAADAEDRYKNKAREDAETYGNAGIAAGVVGSLAAGMSDARSKQEIQEVGIASYVEGRKDERDATRIAPQVQPQYLSPAQPPARPLVVRALDWWGENVVGPMSEQLPEGAARTYEGSEAKRRLRYAPVEKSGNVRFAEPRTAPTELEMGPYMPPPPPQQPAMSDERLKSITSALDAEDTATARKLAAGGPVRTGGRQREDVGAPAMNERRMSGSLDDARVRDIGAELDREDDKTLRSLRGYTYEYKPEAQQRYGVPPGPQYGVMAQDVESTPLGATMVRQLPDGTKVLDQSAVARATPALIGRVAQRQDETEQQLASLSSALDEEDAKTRRELQRGGRVRAGGGY